MLRCIGFGDRIRLKRTNMYHTMKVNESDVKKLANYLLKSGLITHQEKSVQLSKKDKNGNFYL